MFHDMFIRLFVDVARSDVDVISPFPEVSRSMSTHITYLDTTGRPAVTLAYKDLTDKHTGIIYVSALFNVEFEEYLKISCSGFLSGSIMGPLEEAPVRWCSFLQLLCPCLHG